MIKKIKNKINKVINSRIRQIKDQQYHNQQTIFCYNQLSQLFNDDAFIPFSSWAISPNTILHILNDITINKRKAIIEFGSGASTFYIAKLLKILKSDAIFYSIESDENWSIELQKQLNLYGIDKFVRIIYAPLSIVDAKYTFKDQKKWYDINCIKGELEQKEFDLVLVDGPFGGSTPYARYSAIPFLENTLSKNVSIYLDDALREDEIEILEQWSKITGNDPIIVDQRYAYLGKSEKFFVAPFRLKQF